MINEQELQQEAVQVSEQVNAVVVRDQETYSIAGNMILALDKLKKKITDYWAEPIDTAFKAHKALTAKRAEMLNPIEDRGKALNRKMGEYATEQDRIRREEQRKIDEARRKKEDDERRKLEERARKAEEAGKEAKAEELREKAEAVYIPPTVVVPEVEKTTRTDSGTISQVKDIDIEIYNPLSVMKSIAAGELPLSIVTINEAKLKAHIKAFDLKAIPGVTVTPKITAKFRGK